MGIATNAGAIGVNAAGIGMNAGNIAANLASINTNVTNIAANAVNVRKANEGIAMALAMESPVLGPDASFGLAGGFGYFQNRLAGSASFSARIGKNAFFTGGVGVGTDSGEIGARGGFQVSW